MIDGTDLSNMTIEYPSEQGSQKFGLRYQVGTEYFYFEKDGKKVLISEYYSNMIKKNLVDKTDFKISVSIFEVIKDS